MRIFFQNPTKGPLITVSFGDRDDVSLAFVPAAMDCAVKSGAVTTGGAVSAPVVAISAVVGGLVPGDSSPHHLQGINRFATLATATGPKDGEQAVSDASPVGPAPVGLPEDISPTTAADVNPMTNLADAILAPLIAQMDLRAERDIDTVHALYRELIEQGASPQEAVDRIAQLYGILNNLSGIRKREMVQILDLTPAVLTALRYSGVSKAEAWDILLTHARTDWPFLPKLLVEYSKFLTPGHSFNLRYIRSAWALREALTLNGFLSLGHPATFAILDRFAEMGWTDEDVFKLVRAMENAMSNRTMWGFARGYPDQLENAHFQLLPPIVEALGGHNPARRAAIIDFIAQLTQDTGQGYLAHALHAIGLLAARERLSPEGQEDILATRAWELYVRQAHDEGILIPDPTGTERKQFEVHFAYLFNAPFDLGFIQSLHAILQALNNNIHRTRLDHPERFALWQELKSLGWSKDNLVEFLKVVHRGWHLLLRDTLSDHILVVLKAATTLGALNVTNWAPIIHTIDDIVRKKFRPEDFTISLQRSNEEVIAALQHLADFAVLPSSSPGNIEQHISSIIQGIAKGNLTTWSNVYRSIGNNREKQNALVEALRNRAKNGDHVAARALHNLPKIFQALEVD